MQTKILQVHNPFQWNEPVTYLSFAIRVFTCSFINHSAILKDGIVYEMRGEGLVLTEYPEWLENANRTVWVFDSKVPVTVPFQTAYDIIGGTHIKYGFLDILQIAWFLIRTRWLGHNYEWDGKKGTRLWKGVICSELVGIALGKPKPYLIIPDDINKFPELVFEREFKTFKKAGKRYGIT